MPDDLDMPPAEALVEAQRLLDADRPFHAHEVLEAVWKAAPESERELWRGLAQVAVGITHLRRGNARGAESLLSRAADRIFPYQEAPPYGIDVRGIVRQARDLTREPHDGPITLRLSTD
jgi:predicted metal-dependent hydrolase